MDDEGIAATLSFLREAERLKDVLRSSHTSTGRHESTAEHTWRLCLWIIAFSDELKGVDIARLLKICIVHDLGEAISGDIPAIKQTFNDGKAAMERADLLTLLDPLPDAKKSEIVALWDEYEAAETLEARLAKGFDKLETILQHNQGLNPADFDYAFNLDYGAKHTGTHSLLRRIRTMLDQETSARNDAARD